MVSRGRMLLHSACVELDGVGVMLSALTDTGKTGTILRLLREHGGRFLSDDMTIIDAARQRLLLPQAADDQRAHAARGLRRRPHPVRVAQAAVPEPPALQGRPLDRAWRWPVQPADHGHQRPHPDARPAAQVHRRPAGPCRMTSATQVRELFIIERGTPAGRPGPRSALEQLIANTDDAYGFPPFRYLAPAITIDGQDYHRAAEGRARHPGQLPRPLRAHPGARLRHLQLGRRDPGPYRRRQA